MAIGPKIEYAREKMGWPQDRKQAKFVQGNFAQSEKYTVAIAAKRLSKEERLI